MFHSGAPATPATCTPHGAQGTWHPLGRLLPAPAVGPGRAGRCLGNQGAAAASAHLVGSWLLIVIHAWSGGVQTAGKGTGARWQRVEQGATYHTLPVDTVSEPPNLVVAERARLWDKGFEDTPKPTASHEALSCTVFPSSLGPPARSPQTLRGAISLRESLLAFGKSRGLSCLVTPPAGTLQPPLWPAGPALLQALLQPSRPLATCWDGEGKGLRIAP